MISHAHPDNQTHLVPHTVKASGADEATANEPVLAHLRLVSWQHRARHGTCTELAQCRQLRDRLLDGEVATAQRTTDLASTARTRRRLVLET